VGDPARHRAFADLIADRWPDRSLRVADVGGGHGHLNAALYQHGYRSVITFDKRRKRWGRAHYVYGTFGPHVSRRFDLVVGMHPDEATDVLMAWAIDRGLPFAVVPCCTRPTAWPYERRAGQDEWIDHLAMATTDRGYLVDRIELPIAGARRVLIGTPSQNGSPT
jgi:hypothetical protein